MKGLILAAGEGSRLRPLTLERPKPMVPLGGRPLLDHLIALLRHHGVTELAINLHYKPEAIVEHVGSGEALGVSVTYSPEERLLGSAGAAKQLERFLDETFVVLYGDVLTDLDLPSLIRHHRETGSLATIAVHEVPDPSRCGIAELDADDRVVRFIEKPSPHETFSNLANAGIYVVEPDVLGHIPADEPFDFGHDLFPLMLQRGLPMYGHRTPGYILDIGSLDRYEQAQADLAAGRVVSFADQPAGSLSR